MPAPGGKGAASSEAARTAAAIDLSTLGLLAPYKNEDDVPLGQLDDAIIMRKKKQRTSVGQDAAAATAETGDGKPADGGADHELLSEEFQRHLWGGFDSGGPDDD